jgi:ABC-2 type transport system permease protein
MPIFDQGYRHWEGKLSGHAWRWLTITRYGVRAHMKNRWTRVVTLFALVPALTLGVFLVIWGLVEQKSSLVAPLLPLFQGILGPEGLEGPKAFRHAIWTIAYQYFFHVQLTFAMILVVLVGPGLISQDLRFNAMPLYFSRPLRRIDYFVGKLGIIGFFLGMVAIVPALIAYVLGISFSLDLSVAWDTARIVMAAVAYGLVIVVSAGTLMLAVSSLSRNSRYVMVAWVGFWLISNAAMGILIGTVHKDWCHLVSYTNNVERIGTALLDTRSAWTQIADVLAKQSQAFNGMSRPGRGPRPHMEQAPRGPGDGPPPMRGSRPLGPEDQKAVILAMAGPPQPWSWSAGVLAGLFGLSLWILSSRVKSLDRLR